jgi:nucleoside-diphosphate-sugar epimerase
VRVLVTGGTGRLGRLVVQDLIRDCEVRVIGRSEPPAGFPGTFIKGDITQPEDVRLAAEGVDAIVHLAAIVRNIADHDLLFRTNVCGTFYLLEAAVEHGVKRIVFASSSHAMGRGYDREGHPLPISYLPFDERSPSCPNDLYGLSKYLGEQLCATYTRMFGIQTICLRFGWILGEVHEYQRAYSFPTEHENFWVYVDRRDAARAVRCALFADGITHAVVNISALDYLSDKDVASLLRDHYPNTVQSVRDTQGFLTEGNKSFFDVTLAKALLGFQPVHSFREFIAKNGTTT